MIPVDAPYTPWVLGVVLIALLGMLVWRAITKDRREYQRFKRYQTTDRRQAMLHKWLLESLSWFGGSAIIVLVLVWGFIPRMLAQVESWPPMQSFRGVLADSGLVSGLIVGGAIGIVVAVIASVFLGRNVEEVPTIGDIHALLPRNRAELKYGWLLSINAGVVEELLFRLAVPALIFGVFGNALLAVVVSLIVFGALHAYQGAPGIIASFVLGTLLMALFLLTGSILWAILAHALFDLRSLVLIPVVVYKVHRLEEERRTIGVEDKPAIEVNQSVPSQPQSESRSEPPSPPPA